MSKITILSLAWDGLVANLSRAIDRWSPPDLGKETEYRDSLAAHLKECAPNGRVQIEYRHLGTTTDIYFEFDGVFGNHKAFIELKRNLKQKSELDRLIGQTEHLKPRKDNVIIIVLCGDTAPALLDRLREQYKAHLGWNIRIIEKPNSAPASA
jgi:hypothetical protein